MAARSVTAAEFDRYLTALGAIRARRHQLPSAQFWCL